MDSKVKNYSVQEMPEKHWERLTIQEINKCIAETNISVFEGDVYIFARSLEALVQEKNGG